MIEEHYNISRKWGKFRYGNRYVIWLGYLIMECSEHDAYDMEKTSRNMFHVRNLPLSYFYYVSFIISALL